MVRNQPRAASRTARLPCARSALERRRESAPVHEDILALYQRWLSNHDPLAAQQLRALGINLPGSELRQ